MRGMRAREETLDAGWSLLMAAAQSGDAASYDRLLRQILPFLRALIRRGLPGEALVEDVVQDVLLTIHRVRHTYDPAKPFSPWLAAIATRRTIDAIRRRRRIDRHEADDPLAYENAADESAAPCEPARLEQDLLRRWLDELPAGQRQAIELLKVRELSLHEASRTSGQSVGALKVSVHRALKALRLRANTHSE